jgi:hypothetical protein
MHEAQIFLNIYFASDDLKLLECRQPAALLCHAALLTVSGQAQLQSKLFVHIADALLHNPREPDDVSIAARELCCFLSKTRNLSIIVLQK